MTDTDKDSVRLLLDRIALYLEAEHASGSEGRTYHQQHPATLLHEAEDTIEDLAIRAGLWGPPRTVARGSPAAELERREWAPPRRQEVYDATVAGIAIGMAIQDASPAPDCSPSDSGGACDAGGGGGE